MPNTVLKVVQSTSINKAAAKREQLREQLWPGFSAELWDRKKEKGFCTIPRTLPLIMTLIDLLGEKGKDSSRVYFDLWSRAFDDYCIEVSDEEEFAFSSGYDAPTRNVRSWKERITVLEKLGFIHIAPKGSRRFGYILLLDPHKVVKKLHQLGKVPPNWWGAYTKRATDIGCTLP